jgi:hypothetical protein
MKGHTTLFLLALSSSLLGGTLRASAQTHQSIVCNDEGKECHIDDEILIQFDEKSLEMSVIQDHSKLDVPLQVLLTPGALDLLSQTAGFDMSAVTAHKFAPQLDPEQTTTTDNTGETVELDKFWAVFRLELPAGTKEDMLCVSLRQLFPLVGFAHLNWTITRHSVPNDVSYASKQISLHPSSQFPAANINVEGAWDHETGKSAIKVGVVDTGIRADHEDLQFNGSSVVVDGYDAFTQTSPGNSFVDSYNHGTSVAGIIGAVRHNGLGIAGIAGGNGMAQGVSLYSLKDSDNAGNGTITTVASAILQGALTPSLGGFGNNIINVSSSAELRSGARLFVDFALPMLALRQASLNKVTVVASAGNNETSTGPLYPAQVRDNWTLTVGGADENGNHYAESSNIGLPDAPAFSTPHPFVDVVAPASNAHAQSTNLALQTVYSLSGASPTAYKDFRRTSAAAPHAAGVAALMMSYYNNNPSQPNNSLYPEDVENLMKDFAKDISTSPASVGKDDYTGAGMIDASATLKALWGPCYRIYHSPVISADPTVPGFEVTPVGGRQDYYMEGGTRLFPGVYNAQAYRVRILAPAPYSASFQGEQFWALNGTNALSSFFGPPVPFTGAAFTNYTPTSMVTMEPGARVVGRAGKTQVILEGYVYYLYDFRSLVGQVPHQVDTNAPQPMMRWMPFDPNDNSNQDGRSMRFTMLSFRLNCESTFGFRASEGQGEGTTALSGAYPNPATKEATLYFPAAATDAPAQVQLTSLAGQPVSTQNLPISRTANGTGAVQVSLAGLPAGTYLYRVITRDGVRQGRIVKAD